MNDLLNKIAIFVAAIAGLAVAVLVVRAWIVQAPPRTAEPVEIGEEVDGDRAVQRLSRAVQFPTVSLTDDGDDATAFVELRQFLEDEFPRFHDVANRQLVNELTPHFTVEGTDPDASHVVFLAHMDVVPIEEGTRGDWTHPPFSGAVKDGYVWGRGTLDNKHNMMAMLEAAESWLAAGERPEHTLHFVFGHDEEIGGLDGAREVARSMEDDGLDVAAVYDEGLFITDGIVPGIEGPMALVGITERGYLTVEITATAGGGHSSMPPDELAVIRLADALRRLDENPMEAAIDGPTRKMFDEIVAHMDVAHRLIFRNLWLFEPVVLSQMIDLPSTNAAVRTTAAPTVLRAGERENVLPQQAVATVNFRIHPRDTTDDVLAHLDERIASEHISVEPVAEMRAEPSPMAAMDSAGYNALKRAFSTVHPDIPLGPNMLIALSDSRHFTDLTPDVYRFTPVTVREPDLERIHGTDERIATGEYLHLIRYYQALFRQW